MTVYTHRPDGRDTIKPPPSCLFMAMSLNLFLADKLSPLVLATQPKLLSVNLTNNLISDVQPGAFANMTRLVRLILTKNKIAKLEEGSLQGSHTLGLQSSDRGTSPLSPFTSVLNNPPISGLVNLVELDLSNNFLTKVPMVALAALNNLKFLNLGSNKIQVMVVIVIPRLQFSGEQRKTHGSGFLSCQLSTILCHKTRSEVFSFCPPPPWVPGAVSPAPSSGRPPLPGPLELGPAH